MAQGQRCHAASTEQCCRGGNLDQFQLGCDALCPCKMFCALPAFLSLAFMAGLALFWAHPQLT